MYGRSLQLMDRWLKKEERQRYNRGKDTKRRGADTYSISYIHTICLDNCMRERVRASQLSPGVPNVLSKFPVVEVICFSTEPVEPM